MADDQSNEDAALSYVLGELNDAERREFESRLATSVELRNLVNELESGLVATAMTAPRRRPSAEIWRRIEKAVLKERKLLPKFPIFWFAWMRNGWAVAAACLAGWLFYAFLTNRHSAFIAEQLKISRHQVAALNAASPLPAHESTHSSTIIVTNIASVELLQARTQEIMELRGKVAQMETKTAQLSHLLGQQQALLNESSRIKFYHLAPVSAYGDTVNTAPPSPGLQRALSMALARDLGWLPAGSTSAPQTGGGLPPAPVNIGGVDFIDLRPDSQNIYRQPPSQPQNGSSQPAVDNSTAATQVQPQAQPQTQPQNSSSQPTVDNSANTAQVQPQTQPQTTSTATSTETTVSNPTIPAYVSGDNLVVALDSTVVPAGSAVTLTASDANQNETGGSFILGNNPAVITLPVIGFSSSSFAPTYIAGLGIIMSFTSPEGQSGTIYFALPASSSSNP